MNKYGVIKFQTPFEKMKDYDLKAEVRLFKSIILQAIIDASNILENVRSQKIELEAKNWLFGKSEDFYETCFRAEIEPDYVIKTARKVIRLNYLNNIYSEQKVA
jgi:hypothetical protein